jgi:hypothetical protein
VNIRAKLLSLASAALLLGSSTAAFAHAPYPPLSLPSHHLLSALQFSKKANPSLFRIPGLSGASSAFVNRNKAIVNGGFNTAFNSAITAKVFQGQITNGQLIGTFYESFTGNNQFETYPFNGHYVLGFGNNALNNMGGPGGNIAPSTLINAISFSGGGSPITPLIHGMAVHGLAGYHLSGSGRLEQNEINALANGAYKNGLKYANTQLNSPIAAGQFFGTDYYNFGGLTWYKNRTYVYAFGTDSLNTGGVGFGGTLNLSTLRDYIQLANGKVFSYSSGLIPASGYYSGSSLDANWLFAIGKSPYNFFTNLAGAPASITFPSFPAGYLYF